MKEVAPNIFAVQQYIGFKNFKFPVNVFVIAGRDGFIFDSGYGTRRNRQHLVREISRISELMKTRGIECSIKRAMASHGHWDHFSGLAFLEKDLGIRILAIRKLASKIKNKKSYIHSFKGKNDRFRDLAQDDLKPLHKIRNRLLHELHILLLGIGFVSNPKVIDENSSLSINGETWQVICLPGHSDDDVVLYSESQGILLAGDLLLRSITTWLGPPRSDLETYINSLEFLLTLPNLKLILPAHGSPIHEPQKRIREAIDHRNERTRELFNLLLNAGETGLLFEEILLTFYPGASFFQRPTLGGWIKVTLQYLMDKKAVTIINRQNNTFFKATEPFINDII